MSTKPRKRYFARALLRTAGQSIQSKINFGFFAGGAGIGATIALMIWAFYDLKFRGHGNALPVLLGLITGYLSIRMSRYVDEYWQGMTGERYARDEFEILIKQGYEIINDIPANGFNIDFVVIGPTGVYVIEVKNPTKTSQEKVVYAHNRIFIGPKNYEANSEQFQRNSRCLNRKDPIEQVKSAKNWVTSLLENAGREKIKGIIPVVMFPKFFVDNHIGDIWVLNSKAFANEVHRHPQIFKPEEVLTLASILRAHVQAKMEEVE